MGILTEPDVTIHDRRVSGHTVGVARVVGHLAGTHFVAWLTMKP